MKKIVLTGGGTAGHVMPHLALINELKKDFEIHYIGSADGVEKSIISQFKFIRYHEITTVKLVRSLTLKNLLIPFKLIKGVSQSKKLIKEINPSIIFSKGGYVALPVVYASSKNNIPVISHESDITLGLANKLMLKHVKVMCCSFQKTATSIPNKGLFTGTPLRPELFAGNKDIAQKTCNFSNPNKPTIMFIGGSQGAKAINNALTDAVNELTKKYNIIHITGKNNITDIKNPSYFQTEFVNDLQHYLALSNAVVSRAGSNAINEFLALKKPMLLIPLPTSQSRGDQLLNAEEFKQNGYAKVLNQEDLNKQSLIKSINSLMSSSSVYVSNFNKAKASNAAKIILDLIHKHKL